MFKKKFGEMQQNILKYLCKIGQLFSEIMPLFVGNKNK